MLGDLTSGDPTYDYRPIHTYIVRSLSYIPGASTSVMIPAGTPLLLNYLRGLGLNTPVFRGRISPCTKHRAVNYSRWLKPLEEHRSSFVIDRSPVTGSISFSEPKGQSARKVVLLRFVCGNPHRGTMNNDIIIVVLNEQHLFSLLACSHTAIIHRSEQRRAESRTRMVSSKLPEPRPRATTEVRSR